MKKDPTLILNLAMIAALVVLILAYFGNDLKAMIVAVFGLISASLGKTNHQQKTIIERIEKIENSQTTEKEE